MTTGAGSTSAIQAYHERDAAAAQQEAFLRRFFDIMVASGLCAEGYWPMWSAQARDNAELWPIERGGRMVGGVFFKGQTVHIAIDPEWQGRWITKSMLRAYAQWQHPGELRALMRKDNTRAIEFAKRAGFTFKDDQGLYHLYVKEPPCR